MSTLQTLNNSETGLITRGKINDNFTALNTDKAEKSGATFTGDISVPAEVYGAGWNGSNEVPTKNDLYDKIETMGGGGSVATDAIWDAKGDLAGGTGANTASRLAVGTNGQVLTADSAEVTGLKWTTVAGTGDVTSSAVIADNAIVRGDGGAKGVQSSGATIDDNSNIYSNNYFPNATSTVSSAGTTTLTVASSRIQRITGSTTHTFQLPNATTLPVTSIFEFDNGSSGSVTINNAGGVAQYTLTSGGDILIKCTDNTTSNGVWDIHALAPSIVSWSSGISGLQMNNALSTTPLIQSGASSATAPSFIPQRSASTTGFGGDGTNLHATISGTSRATISASGLLVNGSIDLGNADTTFAREASGIFSVEGEVMNGFATTATAAGTTTLTIASPIVQSFTGTSTQTVRLPTTSIKAGQTYVICNLSTGLVTIQSSGANTITTLGLNQRAIFRALVATPTTAANWTYTETNMNANGQGKRVVVTTQSATPAINTNNGDIFQITGLAQAITSMTSSLTGNPLAGDMMMIQITDNGTARAITWGASFASTTVTLPTTTVISTMLRVLFQRNNANTAWDCISIA